MKIIPLHSVASDREAFFQGQRKLLMVVLPYVITDGVIDVKKKKVRSFLAFPYGVLTIASYVKKFARNQPVVEILDLNIPDSGLTIEQIYRKKIIDFAPDVVGFSMSYDISFRWLKLFSCLTKTISPKTLQVGGGPAITTAYEEVIKECPNLDAVCYSEGEVALKNLIESLNPLSEFNNPPWISSKNLSQTVKPVAVYEELNNVVDVDYGLVNIDAYSMKEAFSPFTKFKEGAKQFFIVTSRGCPFKCVFCAEPSFHGANMRYVDVDDVIRHVSRLVSEHGLNVLTIYDDQLLMNKVRAKELFRKLAPLNIRIEMPNGVTMSYIDEEMAHLMKSAGVDTIFLAIESGVKRVLQEVIKKPLAFDRVKPTIKLLQEAGIFVGAFFVIGLPGERDEERLANRDFIIDSGIDWAFFNYATPLRGSELFRLCKENKWVEDRYLRLGEVDLTDYVIRVPGMDPDKIKSDMFEMNLDVNFVNNRRMRVGDYLTACSSFEEVISRHDGQPFAHYFLAKALEKIGADSQKIKRHQNRFLDIVASDHEWLNMAKKFSLEVAPELV